MIDHIHWLGHGSFVIQGPPLIYINPWRVGRSSLPADVILISHEHYEHCSQPDIDKLRGSHTLIIGSERAVHEIPDCTVLRPWQSHMVDRASIKAVPAYSPRDWRHPQDHGGLGFIISLRLYDIYYAGDTQIIPEMAGIKPDIAILPIDGKGTMTVEEAAQVVREMRPRWVIPSNWNSATRLDAQAFKRLCEANNISEVVLPQMV
ncbi:MAG: MBL fold metallo-hydrolase [Anaerolineae bacterium]|nr:MBL fold metallo-hydrolase [Anaerolineae bacterium]